MRRALSLLLLAPIFVGCTSKSSDSPKIPLAQMQGTASTNVAPSEGLTGTVLEQIPASQYVYLRLKTPKGEVWAAVTAAPVTTGSEVTVANPMLMNKFESKTLNRTFDEIYFGTLAQSGTPVANTGTPVGTPPSPAVDVGKVAKASGADARTVSELWSEKSSLAGKTVTVRGVVVKVNDGVMGKNWIHLQDGSGDATRGSNDIAVTSSDRAAKGETVTVTGTVHTDRDFGAGYVYGVIVEDAKIVKK